MRIARAITLAAVLATVTVVAPTSALGKQLVLTPPGKAGANQYFETIPSSGGNAAPPQGATPGPRAAFNGLGRGQAGARALAKLGKEGSAAAALAAATAPPAARSQERSSTGSGQAPVTVSVPQGRSALSALGDVLAGPGVGGLGFVLPLLLIVVVVLAVAYAVLLRPRRPARPPHSGS